MTITVEVPYEHEAPHTTVEAMAAISGHYHPGCDGTYWEPPEPAYFEYESASLIFGRGRNRVEVDADLSEWFEANYDAVESEVIEQINDYFEEPSDPRDDYNEELNDYFNPL